MTDPEKVERGHSAERALDEFLRPEFDYARDQYLRRLLQVMRAGPAEMSRQAKFEAIEMLCNAVIACDEVENGIVHAVREGEHARSRMLSAERVENLSPARRRLAQIGVI